MRIEDCPAVCISLERRPDRWAAFKATADAAGLPVRRLDAVDARAFTEPAHRHPGISLLTAHNVFYSQRRSHYEIDVPGAIGASLSHFKAWESLLQSPPSVAALMVFEDDCALPVDIRSRLELILAALPAEGWDMIQFQNTRFAGGETGCEPAPPDVAPFPWQVCKSLMGAHAYMISREGAQKMLARAYPIELHVDAYMAFMSRLGYIRMLWHPLLDIQPPDGSDTDIGHGMGSILNVPTRMEKKGVVALESREVVGLLAVAAIVGAAVALAYCPRK
jgi:GR25 family glycosyltransferase involved in LPS biosynthesis